VIESATSLHTCNIAQPNTALAVTGTFALDTYLKNNTPPKFLIFQFTAPDFARHDQNGRLYEEGVLQLTRHKFDRQTLQLFASHPMQTLEFSEFILRTALIERDWKDENYRRSWQQIQATHGLFTPPWPALKACAATLEARPPDASRIEQLRQKYSQNGTRVLVYVAPYPECDASYDYYSARLASISDNPVRKFDIHLFNEQNHFTRAGADLNSASIAQDIQRLVRK
jgi:hypothetical protein